MSILSTVDVPKAQAHTLPAKARDALRGKVVSPEFYESITIVVEIGERMPLGFKIRNETVVSVCVGSACQGQLFVGDVILTINDVPLTYDKMKNRELFKKIPFGKVQLKVLRFKQIAPGKHAVHKDYVKQEGFTYEWKMVYLMSNMSFGLEVRDIEGKVVVANIIPGTIASMSLAIGERIIDIDGELVENSQQMQMINARKMEQHGMTRFCVECPCTDYTKNATRIAILKTNVEPMDYPLPADIVPMVEMGIQALKLPEPKSIYKGNEAKAAASKTKVGSAPASGEDKGKKRKGVGFNEKTKEHGVLVETKSRLLIKVPPPKTAETENAAMQNQ